jgi:hypothetical protein
VIAVLSKAKSLLLPRYASLLLDNPLCCSSFFTARNELKCLKCENLQDVRDPKYFLKFIRPVCSNNEVFPVQLVKLVPSSFDVIT